MSEITKTTPIKFKTIKLERTMCFGECPVYKVEILSDGTVHYNGEMFVEKTGKHSWQIDAATIEKMNKAIKYYKYFDIRKIKPTFEATDNPYCILSITLQNGTSKKTNNYHGDNSYPEELDRLENRIDKLIGIGYYIGIKL
jgi:hypothetical protein